FRSAFRARFAEFDDAIALDEGWLLGTPAIVCRNALRDALEPLRGKKRISTGEALALLWAYVALRTDEAISPLVRPLVAEDNARRYVIAPDVLIQAQDGASLSAVVVRKKTWNTPKPT